MFWLYFQWFLSQIPMFHFSMYACTATGHTHAYIVNSIIWPRPWTSDPSIKSQHSKIRFRCVICWSGWGIPPIEGIILKKNSSDAKILDRIKKKLGFSLDLWVDPQRETHFAKCGSDYYYLIKVTQAEWKDLAYIFRPIHGRLLFPELSLSPNFHCRFNFSISLGKIQIPGSSGRHKKHYEINCYLLT